MTIAIIISMSAGFALGMVTYLLIDEQAERRAAITMAKRYGK